MSIDVQQTILTSVSLWYEV